MAYKSAVLRSLFIEQDHFILSHKQYKRILLTGRLCLMTIFVALGYLTFDLYSGLHFTWPYELACAAFAFASFLLNRKGKFLAAKIVLVLTANLSVFIFAINEPIEVGLYMFYITCSLGTLVIFGFEERGKAIFFVLFSIILFLLSIFIHSDFIGQTIYTAEYIRANIIINFIGSSLGSALVIYFLININHHAESKMIKHEKEIIAKNAALTKLNIELDRFVYSTSHDLRAPLMSLHGLLQLARLVSDRDELKSYHEMMEGRVSSLEKLIRDISDYSRNSQQPIAVTSTSVKHLVVDSIENLRFFPGADNIKIHRQVPDDLMITTDLTRLQIILNNVISNAFKYYDNTKANSYIRILVKERLDKIIFLIEDNGIGIPEASLNTIFDMYTRAHDHSFGSGLGLYIVKETVEKLGGTIQVQSRVGEGTSFTIEIPSVVGLARQDDKNANQMNA